MHILERKSTFEIFFCSILLVTAVYTFYLLIYSKGIQQNTLFFGGPGSPDTFMDFFNVLKYISTNDPYHYTLFASISEKAYPPFAYLILYPFSTVTNSMNLNPADVRNSQFGIMSVSIFLGTCILLMCFLFFHYKVGSGLTKAATALALLSSGIFFFSLERGNTIFLAVVCLGAFLFWYKSENRIIRELSYIALACAAGLKVYPVLFGILLLKDKQWSAAVRTIVYGGLVFFLPFLFFTGGFSNISQLLTNVQLNSDAYIFLSPLARFGWPAYYLTTGSSLSELHSWITFGNILMVLSVILCFGFRSQWKTIALLTCALIASPVNSAYYNGLYIFIPIIFFLNEKKHTIYDWITVMLFIVILNPYQFVIDGIVMTVIFANKALLLLYIYLLIEAMILSGVRLYSYFSRKHHWKTGFGSARIPLDNKQ